VGVRISGRRIPGLTLALTGAVLIAATVPAAAATRSKTRFDGIRDCERTAITQLRRHNPAFRRFMIDRAHVTSDRYSERVGPMFVATVYHGRATFEAAAGPRAARFVCLHGGMHRRALFVYMLPE
jgi:hypothetical protein